MLSRTLQGQSSHLEYVHHQRCQGHFKVKVPTCSAYNIINAVKDTSRSKFPPGVCTTSSMLSRTLQGQSSHMERVQHHGCCQGHFKVKVPTWSMYNIISAVKDTSRSKFPPGVRTTAGL